MVMMKYLYDEIGEEDRDSGMPSELDARKRHSKWSARPRSHSKALSSTRESAQDHYIDMSAALPSRPA